MSDEITPLIPAPPKTDVRKQYRAESSQTSEPGSWRQVHVKIYRENGEGIEPTVIYEYDRNYSMLSTFEPFRQLQGESWHDYALISAAYTTFQVLDLETGKVVAERGYPQRHWHRTETHDQYEIAKRDHPEWFEPGGFWEGKGSNDTINGEGFCPVDFYVPTFVGEYVSAEVELEESFAKYSQDEWWQEALAERTGQFGFYSGCIWGDDSSWKLRYIDLSRISEGIVTDDERFGYWELPNGKLRDHVHLEDGSLRLDTQMYVGMDGKLNAYYRKNFNWSDAPQEET